MITEHFPKTGVSVNIDGPCNFSLWPELDVRYKLTMKCLYVSMNNLSLTSFIFRHFLEKEFENVSPHMHLATGENKV